LDAQTGRVYGHVVSGYRTSGIAYLVPADQIVQDIQKQLGHSVKFPGKRLSKTLWSSKKQVRDIPRSSTFASKPSIQHTPPSMAGTVLPPPSPPPQGRAGTGPSMLFGPPPPPLPGSRPSGATQTWNRPPLPLVPSPLLPPPGMRMQLPSRPQTTRIQAITPPKVMDASACLKKLTTYAAYTIRKCPPWEQEKPTWARSEVIEERIAQDDLLKQVKKLEDKGKSVSDKRKALAPNQHGQITALIDDLAGKEGDPSFEWTLAQLDSVQKPVNSKNQSRSRKPLYETVTMMAYLRRAPRKDLDPVVLYQQIEKKRMESMRPPPGPPPPPIMQTSAVPSGALTIHGGDKKASKSRRPKKYIEGDAYSTDDSFDSDTDSGSSSDSVFSSNDTSISSKSRSRSRRHSHSRHRGPYRYSPPPERIRPYVPVRIPLQSPPAFDPVTAAYQAGMADAEAERYSFDRVVRPAERVIERVVEPRAVISYERVEAQFSEPVYAHARYMDDDLSTVRGREAERERERGDYIGERFDSRRDDRSVYDDKIRDREFGTDPKRAEQLRKAEREPDDEAYIESRLDDPRPPSYLD